MNAQPQQSSYPMCNIVAPGEHDALCGRGGHTIHWNGNIKFRGLVEKHRERYLAASRINKGKVVAEVVQLWRSMNPPGRFLTLTNPKLGAEASPWHDIGDKAAQQKTAKRLREGHPESLRSAGESIGHPESLRSAEESIDEHSVESATELRENENLHKEKRHVRRVSKESMPAERPSKRFRPALHVYERMHSLDSIFEDQLLTGKELEYDSFEERLSAEAELELEALFRESQETTNYRYNDIDLEQLSGSFLPASMSANGTYLDQIAVSIPSAAFLTAFIDFD